MSSRGQRKTEHTLLVPESRHAKLTKMNQKLAQDRSKLLKMLQSSSTSNAVRRECEQQLSIVEDKLSIVQGKLRRS